MYDYTRIGYEQVGETRTTDSGMTHAKYTKPSETGSSTIIVSEFSENHPMFKKYGVRELEVKGFNGSKPNFFDLKADVFGHRVEFEPDIWNRETKPNNQVAEMLKRLRKGVNYKQTSFLENLVNIAKHIKK